MRRRRLLAGVVCLALPLLASGCAGDDAPPPEVYAPLSYGYLPKLKLNVGTIAVEDHSQPLGPEDVAATSPIVPAQALAQLARDRLFAAGFAGTATFVIDQASILRVPGGTLNGMLAVHLDIAVPGGTTAGFAAAQVQRSHVPGSDPENFQNNLYDLTKQMVDAMNVEFEFQLRKSLSSWLVTGAPVPAPVEAQPLVPEPPPPPAAPPPPPSPPTSSLYQDPLSPAVTAPPPPPPPPPPQMSPPPGYLQSPPGEAPSTGY